LTTDEVRRNDSEARRVLHTVFRDYGWVHTGLGLMGNAAFLVGSVLFLWESTKVVGVWLFIVGAAGMLLGSIGQAVVWSLDDSSQ